MARSTPIYSAAGRLIGMRVLIAEDSWIVADTLAVILEEEGANVCGPFASARAARQHVRGTGLDFAIVDLNLGDDFADGLVSDLSQEHIPYAVITGYRGLPTDADRDAVEILQKPVDRERLIALLSKHTRRRPKI